MRKRIFYAAIPALAAGIFFACSGSDPQDVITPTEGGTPDVTTTPDVFTQPDTSTSDAGADRTVSDAASDAFPYDTGTPTVIDAGGIYEGGVPCVVGGALEVEPTNDSPSTPDTLNPTVCGAILLGAGADGGIDVDYLKFRLKNTTTSFFIYFEGNIKMTVTVPGADGGVQTVIITPTSGGAVPFVQNQDYSVKVESNDGARQNWRITVFETP